MSTLLDHRKVNVLENQFLEAILDSFQNYDYENAIFLGERFLSINDNENQRCILAEVYLTNGKYWSVYELLKDYKSLRAKFLYAKACYHVEENQEAEKVLLEIINDESEKQYDSSFLGHILNLLGSVKEKLKKKSDAAECYLRAFEQNPKLFTAIQKFLKIQITYVAKDIDKLINVYKLTNDFEYGETQIQHSIFKNYEHMQKYQKENQVLVDINQKKITKEGSSKKISKNTKLSSITVNPSDMRKISGKKRSPVKKKAKEIIKSSSMTKSQLPTSFHKSKTIYDILYLFVKSYSLFQLQNYRQSLSNFESLPVIFQKDPWVLTQVGRCYTELANHEKALQNYQQVFDNHLDRIDGCEIYSSCLWQLKKIKELVQLADRCLKRHFFQSQTWIVLANCYSAKNDHDTALTLLKRAFQLDQKNAYAYCLTGHEFSAKEQYDQAKYAYKNAINLDNKNIRAYWGLGNLHLKTEKYNKAKDYFIKAMEMNSESSTVYTQLAQAEMNLGNLDQALQYVKTAEKLDNKDFYNRYQKAEILNKMKKYDEAQIVCQEFVRDGLRDARIYTLLGDILKSKGQKEEALKAYQLGQDLDKNDTFGIKAKIDKLSPL